MTLALSADSGWWWVLPPLTLLAGVVLGLLMARWAIHR